jgi:hypothetical protein
VLISDARWLPPSDSQVHRGSTIVASAVFLPALLPDSPIFCTIPRSHHADHPGIACLRASHCPSPEHTRAIGCAIAIMAEMI